MSIKQASPSKASKVTTTSARVRAAKAAAKKPKKEKLDPVRIIFVLDRSSSMQAMRDEAINGFNVFLAGQQELPGKATFSFVMFDSDVVVTYDRADLAKVPMLNYGTYIPNGMTALYDAIGYTVDRYRHDTKTEKTIVAILTDGEENSSRRYDSFQVSRMLREVQEEGNWEVLFLGANLDTKKFAQSAGIKLNNTTSYDYTKKGMFDSISAANFATSTLRGASLNVAGQTMNTANFDMTALYDSVKAGTASVNPNLTGAAPQVASSVVNVIIPSGTVKKPDPTASDQK